VPLLLAVVKDPKTPRAKLHAAFALADFGSIHQQFLIDNVASGPAGQCANIVRALRGAKNSALTEIKQRIETAETIEQRVRFATVAFHLSDVKPSQRLLALDKDPSNRMAFIHGYPKWHGDLLQAAKFLRRVKTHPDYADFRSGLSAALGMVSWDELAEPTQKALHETLVKLHSEAPDSGTHSVAAYVLTKYKRTVPSVEPTTRPLDALGQNKREKKAAKLSHTLPVVTCDPP
jgi:hypothetical protein